jgi:hypothetical protein
VSKKPLKRDGNSAAKAEKCTSKKLVVQVTASFFISFSTKESPFDLIWSPE